MSFFRFLILNGLLAVPFVGTAVSQERKVMQIVRKHVEREFNPRFKGKPEREIESLEHQLADAVRSKDSDKLNVLLANSVLVASIVADKKQFIALLKAVDTKYVSLEKSEIRIQMYGDTAVATGIQKADIDLENGSRMSQTVFMNTWKRIHGKWRCISFAN